MDIISSRVDWPTGSRSTILVNICQQSGDEVFGKGHCFGESIFFQHEGLLEDQMVTLYNVVKKGEKKDASWHLNLGGFLSALALVTPKLVILDSYMTCAVV